MLVVVSEIVTDTLSVKGFFIVTLFYVGVLMFSAFMFVADITTSIMSVPVSFKDAFKGIRTYLVQKISPSTIFWNLMMDNSLLLSEHVAEIKVFVFFGF